MEAFFLGGGAGFAAPTCGIFHLYPEETKRIMKGLLTKSTLYLQNKIGGKNFYIVAYHNIVEHLNDSFLFDLNNVSCDKKSFEEHLIFYKKYFHVISYSQLEDNLNSHTVFKPLLIITFDDGYKSFYDIAYPLLKKHELPATVFLPTGFIGKNKRFWWDDIIFLCNKISCREFYQSAFSKYFFPDSKLQFALNNGEEFFKEYILVYFKNFPTSTISRFVFFLSDKFKTVYAENRSLLANATTLTWDNVKELSVQGIDFGSHTINHCQLDKCNSGVLKAEILQSKLIIERELNKTVTAFCYPTGKGATPEVLRFLQECGYKFACSMKYGVNDQQSPSYLHKRIVIDRTTDQPQLHSRILRPWLYHSKEYVKEQSKALQTVTRKIKFASLLPLPSFIQKSRSKSIKHVFLASCDHYEPYWDFATHKMAYTRVKRWVDRLPDIFDKFKDSDGRTPIHTFFYPQEEYKKNLLSMLSSLCVNGYGEVEVHLHHDNDSSDQLRRKLFDFKIKLHEEHGLLSVDNLTKEVKYGFIHGNWALDNARPDGRWCGVNDEISVLLETGCFGDFTMPAAPDICQTNIINSIYYALDDPALPKSHDTGQKAQVGSRVSSQKLLMVQGPLIVRREGFSIKLENSEITPQNPVTAQRVALWFDCAISVADKEDWVFLKLHTHGTQTGTMDFFFNRCGFDNFFHHVESYCQEMGTNLHYVSARQMVNIIHALEDGVSTWDKDLLDYRHVSHFRPT